MNAINGALDQHYAHLVAERESLEQFASAARGLAKSYEQSLQMSSKEAGFITEQAMIRPEFTPREIAQVENFAARQTDSDVRALFETMIRTSTSSGQVSDFTSSSAEQWNPTLGPEQTQSSRDDYLDAARDMLNGVKANSSSELQILNTGGVAAETDTASELLAALL